jgi:hypothetical protein
MRLRSLVETHDMKNYLLLLTVVFALATATIAQPSRSKVNIARKIADATPAALPQSLKDDRPSSDAENENLKGKIKSVAEYYANNEAAKPSRGLSREEFFGEDGNLTRSISYDNGYPSSVAVYRYLDGMRVSRFGDVIYAEGEKPSSIGPDIVARMDDNLKNPRATKDTRYNMRYSYKYDSGARLIEERNIANTGEVWTRLTYEYQPGNRRLKRHFGNGEDEWGRTMEIFDDNGNVVEEWSYDEKHKVSGIYRYTYEFDAHGNWIVQKYFEKKTVKGKTILKALSTSYRTITYYP